MMTALAIHVLGVAVFLVVAIGVVGFAILAEEFINRRQPPGAP